jgi:hypothetical protein
VNLINTINDTPLLDRLFTNAITTNSIEEFQQLIDENMDT